MSDSPNFLLIFADQMHRYAMGCAGNPDIHTPNLDTLAEKGVLFTRAYSNCPICTPFRINLFTGCYSSKTDSMQNSARIPKGVPTLAKQLNNAGYMTSYVGKWHIGGAGQAPIARDLLGDFQRFHGYQCYNGFRDNVRFYDEEGRETAFSCHRTEVTTKVAIEELEHMQTAKEPFFLSVSYQAPHYPVQPSDEFAQMYAGKKLKHRKNFKTVEPYTQTFSPPSPKPRETDPDFQRYGGNMEEYTRLYYAMVSQIDAGVGKIIDALERTGRADNTFVLFTADHGDMQGSHGLVNKCYPYEESAGIPFIAKGPNVPENRVTHAPVSGVDIMPTIVEMAGATSENDIDGSSFIEVFSEAGEDRLAYSEFGDWRMLVKSGWKLVMHSDSREPRELFNLDDDPYELCNLIDLPNHVELIAAMRNDLLKECT